MDFIVKLNMWFDVNSLSEIDIRPWLFFMNEYSNKDFAVRTNV